MTIKDRRRIRFIKSAVTLLVAGGFLCSGIFILWAATLKMPDLSSFEEREVEQSTKIYDRTGEVLLYDIHEDIRRTIVPYEQISPFIKQATVAIEDSKFYEHGGIRVTSFARAVLKNIATADFSQGGSTITQQVIKNSILTPDKKISRKIKEWILAVKLENQLTKDEILEIYLNEVPYGGNVYGIEEASQAFFGKGAQDLTIAESAYLAALPQAPTYYSPHGNHVDELEARKNLVLKNMMKEGFISKSEYDEALEEEVEFEPRSRFGIRAPHFVFFVREYLAEKYGEELVEEGGLKVITTLDWELQQKAEEIVKAAALENEKNFNARNAGMIATDPDTGQILVMVGSRDYFDENIPGAFNVTTTHRQPGSSFKPIVYATAFEKGYTPETVVFDLQTQFSTACNPSNFSNEAPCYSPSNYDNVFRGPMTLRNALAQSVNVPAVKTLYLTGMEDSLETARKMGISSLEEKERYGLTLVLGGGEVSLLDLTGAYGVFANEGKKVKQRPVLRVETAAGEILEEYDRFEEQPEEVLNRATALRMSDILSDNAARTPAFGSASYLYFPGVDVAAKTGTTNDYRDAWIIGYTPEIAVGAWAGNNDNSPMEKKVAGFIVAPMWNQFMQEALKTVPHTNFPAPPADNATKPILRGVWQGGQAISPPRFENGEFDNTFPQEQIVTSVHSILYWVNKDDPRGPYPTNPSSDPQFGLWEYPVRAWASGSGYKDQQVLTVGPQGAQSLEDTPRVDLDIKQNSRGIKVEVDVESKNEITRVVYFINGEIVGSSLNSPDFEASIDIGDIENLSSRNTLRAVAYDEFLNTGFDEVVFSAN